MKPLQRMVLVDRGWVIFGASRRTDTQKNAFLGWPMPFDRHDWYVKRGDKEVRYVIDYYYDEDAGEMDQVPTELHDFSSVKSITVDARPAIDSL